MPGQASNAKQVSRLGETPAEARARMQSSGGGAAPQVETAAPLSEDSSEPTPAQHVAAMREQEGFGGGPTEDSTVEETTDQTAPPSPEKAMETIRQLSQEKIQLITERDAACALVERYRAKHGDLD